MKRAFLLSGLILIFYMTSFSQKVSEVKIYGNRYFTGRYIKELLSLYSEFDNLMKEGLFTLLEEYRKAGFYYAQIDSVRTPKISDSELLDVEIYITEGNLCRVGDLNISGMINIDSSNVKRNLSLSGGSTIRDDKFESDIKYILDLYERRGFPFVKVEIGEVSALRKEGKSTLFKIDLKVDEGPLVKLDSIHFEGNNNTSSRFLLRETRLYKGLIYDQRRIDSAAKRLLRMEFI
ncbi:MAG: POTRA domain-containing protein, partial [Fidelibacterota bacterium]